MSTPSNPARIALQQAIYHHRHGRLREAEVFYRIALRNQPGHPEAGRNLLDALFMSGRYADMENEARAMIEAAPRFGIAWKGLGLAQLMQGKDALNAFILAAKHLPDDAEAHDYLGVTLKRAGRLAEAADSFRRAIKFNAAFPGAHVHLGNILRQLGQHDAAIANYRRALELRPDLAEAHNSLGTVLREQGRMEEALTSCRHALEIAPEVAETHNNLGLVMKDLGRFSEAEMSFRRALECKHDFTDALFNLGTVLRDQGRMEEARASFDALVELNPHDATFRIAQAVNKLPVVARDQHEAEDAAERFDTALRDLTQWMHATSPPAIDTALLQMPFFLAYRKGNQAPLLSRFGDLLAKAHTPPPVRMEDRARIRLAVVLSGFRRNSVWEISLKGLLQQLDRSCFELVLYHLDRTEDEETALAKSLADIWRDARTVSGIDGWLRAFAEDRPDAVFYPELGTDPLAYSLASRRLAPVQATGWGHPVTSGLPTVDLFFSGTLLESADADAHYRERLVRLPGTGCCTLPVALTSQPVPDLQRKLAARTGVRFLIAQMPFKVDPADDALFAAIAAAVDDSTFILPTHPQFPWATAKLVERIGRAFRWRGLVPERHLLVVPWLSQAKFLGLLDLCDVYLDCPSFSGYATARLAIQRGLPVVTLEGPQLRQRLAAGLLQQIGIEDTIAASEQEYIAIAAALAAECRDEEARHVRRERLRMAALLADNDIRVVRAFEQSLIDMLSHHGSRAASA